MNLVREMSASEKLAEFYQEYPFKGAKCLGMAVVLLILAAWLAGSSEQAAEMSGWSFADKASQAISYLALGFYFYGMHQAIRAKGYPPILFLLSVVPLWGLLIVVLLPNLSERQAERVSP